MMLTTTHYEETLSDGSKVHSVCWIDNNGNIPKVVQVNCISEEAAWELREAFRKLAIDAVIQS